MDTARHTPVAQRQDDPHGTTERRRDQEERWKDREIPERVVSDDYLDENWSREFGYDVTHDRAQDLPEPTPSQMTRAGANEYGNTSMLAFMVPLDLAGEIIDGIEGAEEPGQLHVTLCCFDTPPDQDGRDLVAEIATRVCREWGPVTLRATGMAQFDSSDGVYPTVLTMTGNGLAALRTDLVRALKDEGIPVRENYDFTPHCTIAYLPDQGAFQNPPAAEWVAEHIDVVFGNVIEDGEVVEVPLPGEPRTAARLYVEVRQAQRTVSCPQCGGALKGRTPNCPYCGVMLVGWPDEPCFVCGRKTLSDEVTCRQCSGWLAKVKEQSPELTEEQALQVLHRLYMNAGRSADIDVDIHWEARDDTGRTCGHQHGSKWEAENCVSGAAGAWRVWRIETPEYLASRRSALMGVNTKIVILPSEGKGGQAKAPGDPSVRLAQDWWSQMSPQEQEKYVQQHPKTTKKPTKRGPGESAPSDKPYAALPQEFPARVPPGGELEVGPIDLPAGTDLKQYKLRVEGENAEEVAKTLEASIKESANLCNINPPICEQNLGIPRGEMPQLSDEAIPRFLESLAAQGVKVEEGTAHVGELKATQAQLDTANMKQMIEGVAAGTYDPSKSPIIVSKDGYVLDGHHRWGALLLLDPDNQMKVRKVDMPIQDLLKAADPFSGAKKKLSKLRVRARQFLERLAQVSSTVEFQAQGQEQEEGPEFEVGDDVSIKDTILGLRQGDNGKVVGVQGFMVGVAFDSHPQAAIYVDRDLLEKGQEPAEDGEAGGMPGIAAPIASVHPVCFDRHMTSRSAQVDSLAGIEVGQKVVAVDQFEVPNGATIMPGATGEVIEVRAGMIVIRWMGPRGAEQGEHPLREDGAKNIRVAFQEREAQPYRVGPDNMVTFGEDPDPQAVADHKRAIADLNAMLDECDRAGTDPEQDPRFVEIQNRVKSAADRLVGTPEEFAELLKMGIRQDNRLLASLGICVAASEDRMP